MRELTQRREQFCQNVFLGMSYFNAYKSAGYSLTSSKNTIYEHASRLASVDKIKARIAELFALASSDSVATVLERKEMASDLLRDASNRPKDRIGASDHLSKLDGAYAPEKVDITEGLERLLKRLQGRELPEGRDE